MRTTLQSNESNGASETPVTKNKWEIIDDKGRKLVLKKPTVLDEIEFPLLLGADRAANTMFLSRVMPLLYLDSFDGKKVEPFKTFMDVEYTIQKLGHEGIEALTVGCLEFFSPSNEGSAIQERLKKLLGTPS